MACGLSSPAKRQGPIASIKEIGRTGSIMTTKSDVNSTAAILSAMALGTLGVLSFIVQPALVQGFVTHLNLSEPEAFGWIQRAAMDRRISMKAVAEAVISPESALDR